MFMHLFSLSRPSEVVSQMFVLVYSPRPLTPLEWVSILEDVRSVSVDDAEPRYTFICIKHLSILLYKGSIRFLSLSA